MMSVNLREIVILNIKGSDYCCIISLIMKIEALDWLKIADLTEKCETLQVFQKNMKILRSYIKMEKTIIKFEENTKDLFL